MVKIDPAQERDRLAARYAAMSDLELRKVGGDPASLTEWGRFALQQEMQRRGIEWRPDLRIAKPIGEEEILNPVGVYPDRNAAGLERDFLAAKGIKVYFCEEVPPEAEKTRDLEGAKKPYYWHAARTWRPRVSYWRRKRAVRKPHRFRIVMKRVPIGPLSCEDTVTCLKLL